MLFALSGLALTQPVLDLLGRNPEVFIEAQLSSLEIVALAVFVTVAVPLLLVAVECALRLVSPTAGEWWHTAAVFVTGSAFGLVVARHLSLDPTVPAVAVALVVGTAIAVLERGVPTARLLLRYLAIAPLLVLASFVFVSESSRLVWESRDVAVAQTEVGTTAPIVVLILDAAPLTALVDEEGNVDEALFPNFARLAEQSTWFRNAASVDGYTERAVPTILTGTFPEAGELPTATDHPRNLFTLLGDGYDFNVIEPFTQLCPRNVCAPPPGSDVLETWNLDRFRSSLVDAGVVWGHSTLPDGPRGHLPPIDDAWAGFADREDEADLTAGEPTEGRPEDLFPRFTASLAPSDSPTLHLAHIKLPHSSWRLTPEGHLYPRPGQTPGVVRADGSLLGWEEDPFYPLQAQQRMLYQFGLVDRLLGDFLDQLERVGLMDEALLLVVADHGESFVPGGHPRDVTGGAVGTEDVLRVPLFLRVPGQEQGEVRDDIASTVDLLPTIVDALDIETDWEFDGESLLAEPDRDERPFPDDSRIEMDPTIDALLAAAERDAELFPVGGWLGVASVGEFGALVGRPVDEVPVVPLPAGSARVTQAGELADVDRASEELPAMVHGTLQLAPGRPPPENVLVALNGVVAGVGGGLEVEDGDLTFRALLAFELIADGANEIELFIPEGSPEAPRLVPLTLDPPS